MSVLTPLLRLLWPHLQRYLAQQGVDYLEQRRQRRLQIAAEEARLAELIQESGEALPPSKLPATNAGWYQVVGKSYPVQAMSKLMAVNAVWYTLAGILIGSVASLILIFILRKEK